MFGRSSKLPPLAAATGALPPRADAGGFLPNAAASFLKGLGLDPAHIVGMAGEVVAELKRHNELLVDMNARLARIEERQVAEAGRTTELENVLRLAVPEAHVMLVERDVMTAHFEREGGV